MSMKISRTLALGAALAIFGGLTAQTQNAAKIGSAAPAFTLTDSNGKSHNLSDFEGKYVVLEWTNHQCPFVVKHYASGNMQKTQEWATKQGAVWLNIISSKEGAQGYITAEQANTMMKEKGFKCNATLFDTNGNVGRAYGAKTTPHMYVIDPKGTLIYMGGIDDKPTANQADIPGARNHVKEALTEAMAGKPVSVAVSQPYGCSVKY